MTTLSTGTPLEPIDYPDSDGQPMSDNTVQFRTIVKIQGSLDLQYRDDPDVLVVGDLLWYAVQGSPKIRAAPDCMVVFGRPKGDRGSYKQWEEGGVAPHVVFEVRSPGNRDDEMQYKFNFYERHGVEEYYMYDPEFPALEGWLRSGNLLVPIANMHNWVSPRLRIRFDLSSGDMEIYHPDGRPFMTYLEVAAKGAVAEKAVQDAQDAAALAQKGKREAEERADKLAAKLRALGIDPDA